MAIGAGTLENENANTDNYTPSQPSDWVAPAPNTVQQALDRIAATLSNNGVTPLP